MNRIASLLPPPACPIFGERKPKGRGHERRDEILAAAARMFVEKGVDNVSTRGIAQAVGISQTSLYVYFPTKAAILDALCDRCFEHLVDELQKEAREAQAPLEVLRRMMRAFVRFGVEHGDEYRIAFMYKGQHVPTAEEAAALLDPSLPRDSLPPGLKCYLMLQDHVAEVCRAGHIRLDPRVASQAIWAAGHGIVTLLITKTEFPWAPFDVLLDAVIDIQFNGLLGAGVKTNR
jgi:AcrR family transcriptional regulator